MHVRPARPDDLPLFAAWAEREGWQPGVGDIDAFAASDPSGFWVGVDDEQPDAPVIATISLVHYDPTRPGGAAEPPLSGYAFLGYYMLEPAWRGKGLGLQIWESVVASEGAAVVGLDGVLDQVGTYERSGFTLAHLTHRYVGPTSGEIVAAPPGVRIVGLTDEPAAVSLDQLVAYDAAHVPVPRPEFVAAWYLAPSPRRTFLALVGDALVGIATVRPTAGEIARVGPLFADDPEVAAALLARCAQSASAWSDRMGVDVPETHQAAIDLAISRGMAPEFACARMYRGEHPTYNHAGVFGNTTFECG